jgi:acid phosphatase family membrane protein YuiD
MNPAAVLSILVQAQGIAEVSRKLTNVEGDLHKAARAAGTMDDKMDGLDKGSKKGAGALGGLKGAAMMAGGALGAAGLVGGLKSAMSAYDESRKIAALTNSVIKSTGGAANVTSKQVGVLSESIARKTGIDDEQIQTGANLLLTFKNVRNESGRGRDVFNQATAAAVDLSASGFGSLESTSKQLGKALNDPVKGMSALGKSGVTFSEDQKKAIEALMKTGKAADRVKAQQMILKEVQSQVGGSAAAQATPMDKLRVVLGNIAEKIGGFLIPALDKGASFLSSLIGGIEKGTGAGGVFRDIIVTAFGAVKDAISTAITFARGFLSSHRDDLDAAAEAARNIAKAAMWAFEEILLPIVQRVLPIVQGIVEGAFKAIGGFVQLLIGIFTGDFRKMWEGLKDIFEGGLGVLLSVLKGAWGLVKDAAGLIVDGIVAGIKALPGALIEAAGWVLSTLWAAISAAPGAIVDIGKWIGGKVVDGVKALADLVAGAGKWILDKIWLAISGAPEAIVNIGKWVLGKVVDGVKTVVDALTSIPGWLLARIKEGVELIADGYQAIGKWVLRTVVEGIKALPGALEDLGGWVKNRLLDGLELAKDGILGVGEWVLGKVVAGFKGLLNKIEDLAVDIKDALEKGLKKAFKDGIDLPFGLSFSLTGTAGDAVKKTGAGLPVGGFSTLQALADASLGWGLSGGRGVGQGYRPGDDGWHGQNRARDLSGPAGAMLGFAQMLSSTMGGRLLELIHTPLGFGIKNGKKVPLSFWGAAINADHYDHVHAAMEKGGYVRAGGWAVVGEKGPELAHLPTGSSVYPADQTRSMLAGGGRPTVEIHGDVNIGSKAAAEVAMNRLAFRAAFG